MFAKDEAEAAAKAAEREAAKVEEGPTVGEVAIKAAEAAFDQQKAERIAAEQAQLAAKEAAAKANANVDGGEKRAAAPLKGESWVANMPAYIVENAPFAGHKE